MESNQELVDYLRERGYLKTPRVIRAFERVDRGLFVPGTLQEEAYHDHPLHVMKGQTISQPLVVATMTEALDVRSGVRVLDVGSGSGYQAALLAELVGSKGRVYTIDRVPEIAEYARERLRKYKNVEWFCGDGSLGLPDRAPFDRIIVTAACPRIPKPLEEQLARGGKMVLPVAALFGQELVLVEKSKSGTETKSILPVVFVPLIGEHGYP